MQASPTHKLTHKPFNILLVDDDIDDRFFFKDVLSELPIPTHFATIDGQELIDYLSKEIDKLPDVIFLDLNMPSKNGFECLAELKSSKELQHIPVIIYSTSFHNTVADELYKSGACYYMRKSDLVELKKMLLRVLTMMVENLSAGKVEKLDRPPSNKFVLNFLKE